MTKEEYTAKVVQLVKAQLGAEPWFRGVCCDDLDEDFEAGKSPEEAAENAGALTFFYDGDWASSPCKGEGE